MELVFTLKQEFGNHPVSPTGKAILLPNFSYGLRQKSQSFARDGTKDSQPCLIIIADR